jgi:hypothetical protein
MPYSATITADASAPGQPARPFSVIVTEFADQDQRAGVGSRGDGRRVDCGE